MSEKASFATAGVEFLNGGGTTGALLRAQDWSLSPLGDPKTWPQSLRTAASLMLGAAQPASIAWGPKLISLFNDGYLSIVGANHPGIGVPYAVLWAEIWNKIRPPVERALAGEAQHLVDTPITLSGRPGKPVGYFTFSFTPLRAEDGSVAGLYCAATETTDKVLAEASLHAGEARLRGLLDCMSEGFTLLAPDFTILDINLEGMRLETRPRDAIVGSTYWTAYPGSEEKDIGRLYKRAMVERMPVSLEHRHDSEDGRVGWLDMRVYPTPDGGLAVFYRDVTQRLLAEERLRTSEERLRLAVENAEVGHWDIDEVNHTLVCPTRTKVMFGISADKSITRQDFFDGLHPDDRLAMREAYMAAADPKRRALYDAQYRTVGKEDGLLRWVAAKGRGVFDIDGRCLRVAGTVIDITAQKAAEIALRKSEELNRRFLQSSSDCIKVLDLDGHLEFMSEGGLCIMEVDDFAAVEGTFWPDFWPGEGRSMALAAITDAKNGGTGRHQSFAPTMKGTPRWWDVAITSIDGPDGRPEKLLCVSRDVTPTKAVEAALQASEARYEAIANSVDHMIWTTRPDGFHDYYNDRWYEFTGVPRGTTDGEAWNGMFHPDDQDRAWANWRRSLETGEPYEIEYRLRHRSGKYRWVIGRAQCVRSEAGHIIRWFGTCTDIQEIVEAREVLAGSRKELERLVDERTAERDRMWETSPDLMAVIDFEGVFRLVNPAWTAILGYTSEELVGHHVNEFVLSEDHAGTVDAYETAAKGGRPSIENRYRHKDGTTRWISWVAAPAGRLTYATGRDVTSAKQRQAELEAAQSALRQSQKMEAVGQLTGGIAHDFNNLLAVIMGSLTLLGRRIDVGDARAKRYLDAATDGARRSAMLTQRLLAFSRQQPLKPEPIHANKLVAGMSDLVRQSLGGAIELETVLSGGLWQICADTSQLENVILNLAVNARDAMPNGGKLTIETQNAHLDSRYVTTEVGLHAGQYVLIAVTDTGSGMSEEVAAKAFDPFFTTKEVGKGTGLGLSQVYGFVKQSSGHVKIYSEPGQGTAFKVYLPRYVGAMSERPEETTFDSLPQGETQEVVLVVEDEPAVRQLSVDSLIELGYRVLEADGAVSALRLLDAHPEIALLFTDIVMPEVNGAKLAEEARRRRPDLRVLFTTGYTRNAVVHNGVVDPGVELIGKPFSLEELAVKVREVLDASFPDAQFQLSS